MENRNNLDSNRDSRMADSDRTSQFGSSGTSSNRFGSSGSNKTQDKTSKRREEEDEDNMSSSSSSRPGSGSFKPGDKR